MRVLAVFCRGQEVRLASLLDELSMLTLTCLGGMGGGGGGGMRGAYRGA